MNKCFFLMYYTIYCFVVTRIHYKLQIFSGKRTHMLVVCVLVKIILELVLLVIAVSLELVFSECCLGNFLCPIKICIELALCVIAVCLDLADSKCSLAFFYLVKIFFKLVLLVIAVSLDVVVLECSLGVTLSLFCILDSVRDTYKDDRVKVPGRVIEASAPT